MDELTALKESGFIPSGKTETPKNEQGSSNDGGNGGAEGAAGGNEGSQGDESKPDYGKYLSELSEGSLTSEDDLKLLLSATKELGVKNGNDLKSAFNKLQTERVVPANAYVKGLNDWLANGGDKATYDTIHTIDVKSLKPEDAIRHNIVVDNPGLTSEEYQLLYDEKMKQYTTDDTATDAQKKLAALRLKQDGQKAIDGIKKLQEENKVPASAKAQEARVAAWKPNYSKIVDEFKSITIPLETDDEGNVTESFDFEIPNDPKVKADLLKHLTDVIEGSDVPHNAEGVKIAKQVLSNFVASRFLPSVLKAAISNVKTTEADETHKKIHNPSHGKVKPKPAGGGKEKGDTLSQIMEIEGLNTRRI